MPTSSVGNSRGITLLELVVVLAIVGLIAGVSFPAISSGMDGIRLRTATDAIATFLNGAMNRSERRRQVVEIVVLRRENRLLMYSTEPGFERKLEMPSGVTIQAVLPAMPGDEEGAPRRFLLMPGGTAPRIGIQVATQRHGSGRTVRLDPMTGYPRVEESGGR